jgi:hypothetical protein
MDSILENKIPAGTGAALFLSACLFFLLAFLPHRAFADAIALKNMVMDNQAGTISARFGINLNSRQKVIDALENGINLKLECDAVLYKHKRLWPDSKVGKAHYIDRLFYDSLSSEFVLEQPGVPNPIRGKNLENILKRGWDTIVLDLGPWNQLERGVHYQLILKVKLDQDEVPAWLKYTLFFWSWNVVPTATYQLDFVY